MRNRKITQNIVLLAVMAIMPLLVMRGDTYQIGLIVGFIAVVISLSLLFTSANKKEFSAFASGGYFVAIYTCVIFTPVAYILVWGWF